VLVEESWRAVSELGLLTGKERGGGGYIRGAGEERELKSEAMTERESESGTEQ
jgi:hypothetical protein